MVIAIFRSVSIKIVLVDYHEEEKMNADSRRPVNEVTERDREDERLKMRTSREFLSISGEIKRDPGWPHA